MARFDLIRAYQIAFGYKGIPFIGLDTTTVVNKPAKGDAIETIKEASAATGFNKNSSILGTPFFMPCKLDDFQLPNEPIIEIRFNKSIVKTPIDGIEGTFKEQFSFGDYSIRIRGIATLDNSDEYPEAQIRAIRKLIETKTDVKVVNNLLGYFGVYSLVIEDGDFPAIEGAPGMQPYELNCLSDKFFDLDLLEGVV